MQLPILEDVIDPDALETFIHKLQDGHVSFTYADQEITTTNDGEITLEEAPVSTPVIEPR